MTYKLNLFFYCRLVILIIVSNASIRISNNLESKESKFNSLNLHDDHSNTLVKDVTLMDNKECDCGEHGLSCTFNEDNGKQNCTCADGYEPKLFNFTMGAQTCEKCDCGEFGHSCKFNEKDGKKNCQCDEGYGIKFLNLTTEEQTCEKCDCGSNGIKCMIVEDKKICRCQLGKYEKSFIFTTDEKCKECNCGPNSISCDFNSEKNRFCKCVEGYSSETESNDSEDEYCKPCNCGEYGKCNVTVVDNRSIKECICKPGYVEFQGKCEKCDCGTNSIQCRILREGKHCTCQLGKYMDSFFTTNDKKCKECECGSDSESCDFNRERSRFCKCKEGYSSEKESENSKDEYCKRCDCGEHGKCKVKIVENRSVKECFCEPGYLEFKGKCKRCDCGLNSLNCTFYESNGNRMCDCKRGYMTKKSYVWNDEYCEKCDCGEHSVSCKYLAGIRACTCQEGYTSFSGDLNDYCTKESWLSGGMIAVIVVAAVIFVLVAAVVVFKFFRMSSRWH